MNLRITFKAIWFEMDGSRHSQVFLRRDDAEHACRINGREGEVLMLGDDDWHNRHADCANDEGQMPHVEPSTPAKQSRCRAYGEEMDRLADVFGVERQ